MMIWMTYTGSYLKVSKMEDDKITFVTGCRRIDKIRNPLLSAGINLNIIDYLEFKKQSFSQIRFLHKLLKTVPGSKVLLSDRESHYLFLTLFIGKIMRIPVLLRPRGNKILEKKFKAEYFLEGRRYGKAFFYYFLTYLNSFLFNFVDGFIPVSEHLAKQITKNKRYVVVHTPIDFKRFEESNGKEKTLLSVTIFDNPLKVAALEYFIKKYHTFLKANGLTLYVAGGGHLFESTKNKYGSYESITFLGYVDKIEALYQESKVFLHFSYFDAYPSVVNEAQANRLPVIVNDCCGMIEQVDDGEDGFIISLDDEEKMIEKITLLVKSDKLVSSMGEKGFKKVHSSNNTKKIGERLKEAIAYLLDERG